MSKDTSHGFAKVRALAACALKHFAIAALPDRLKFMGWWLDALNLAKIPPLDDGAQDDRTHHEILADIAGVIRDRGLDLFPGVVEARPATAGEGVTLRLADGMLVHVKLTLETDLSVVELHGAGGSPKLCPICKQGGGNHTLHCPRRLQKDVVGGPAVGDAVVPSAPLVPAAPAAGPVPRSPSQAAAAARAEAERAAMVHRNLTGIAPPPKPGPPVKTTLNVEQKELKRISAVCSLCEGIGDKHLSTCPRARRTFPNAPVSGPADPSDPSVGIASPGGSSARPDRPLEASGAGTGQAQPSEGQAIPTPAQADPPPPDGFVRVPLPPPTVDVVGPDRRQRLRALRREKLELEQKGYHADVVHGKVPEEITARHAEVEAELQKLTAEVDAEKREAARKAAPTTDLAGGGAVIVTDSGEILVDGKLAGTVDEAVAEMEADAAKGAEAAEAAKALDPAAAAAEPVYRVIFRRTPPLPLHDGDPRPPPLSDETIAKLAAVESKRRTLEEVIETCREFSTTAKLYAASGGALAFRVAEDGAVVATVASPSSTGVAPPSLGEAPTEPAPAPTEPAPAPTE